MSFSDPTPIGRPVLPRRSQVEQLSADLEHATEAFQREADDEAVQENAYLRAYSIAYLAAGDVAVTARGKHADNQENVVEAKCLWNIVKARKETAKRKWDEIQHRLMAALSNQRMQREQT